MGWWRENFGNILQAADCDVCEQYLEYCRCEDKWCHFYKCQYGDGYGTHRLSECGTKETPKKKRKRRKKTTNKNPSTDDTGKQLEKPAQVAGSAWVYSFDIRPHQVSVKDSTKKRKNAKEKYRHKYKCDVCDHRWEEIKTKKDSTRARCKGDHSTTKTTPVTA